MKEVKRIIQLEKRLYLPTGTLIPRLVKSKNWSIFCWQKHLRLEEYYSEVNSLIGRILHIYHKRMKNILGQKLGFDVPAGVFKEGLCIHHVGTISVNQDTSVGKNCDIAANICLGGIAGGAPMLGDNIQIGWGACIIGNVIIADDCQVGGGAVVTNSCNESGSVLCGVPAKVVKKKVK